MKKYAVIAAGGSGQRMGSAMPKQYLEINGRSLLWHSVNAFAGTFPDIEIIVVAPASHLEQARESCAGFEGLRFTMGGDTRFQSVKNGLSLVSEPSIVFVHDAVRCLVTGQLLQRCYQQALDKGSAIPAVAVNDSIRLVENGKHRVIDRSGIRIIQTPQVFRSELILPAFEADYDHRFTDEATVVELSGQEVLLIEGETTNIKITRPVDLVVAEKLLMERLSPEQP